MAVTSSEMRAVLCSTWSSSSARLSIPSIQGRMRTTDSSPIRPAISVEPLGAEAGRGEDRGEAPGVLGVVLLQPLGQGILEIALRHRIELRLLVAMGDHREGRLLDLEHLLPLGGGERAVALQDQVLQAAQGLAELPRRPRRGGGRIVELVGEAGRHLAEGGHLLLLAELGVDVGRPAGQGGEHDAGHGRALGDQPAEACRERRGSPGRVPTRGRWRGPARR